MRSLSRNWQPVLNLIGRQSRLAFFLDFDGTLSPLAKRPHEAVFPPAMKEVLGELARRPHMRVAIISGRPLNFLKSTVGMPGVFYAGNHGLEISGPRLSFRYGDSDDFRPVMDRLSAAFGPRLKKIPETLLENKGATLCLHYRNVPPAARPAFHRLVKNFKSETEGKPVLWRAGKKIWEVLPKVDWNKGEALRYLLDRLKGPFPVVVGDDKTDEDMFREINGRGVAIRVGRARFSAASYYVEDSGAVLRFLRAVRDGERSVR